MSFLIFILFLNFIYKLFLSILEINFVNKKLNQEAVVLSQEDYKKAGFTKIINEKFEIFSNLYSFLISIFFIVFGLKFLFNTIVVDPKNIWQNLAFVVAFLILNFILALPLDFYKSFVKDKKLGFSNMTLKIFLLDTVKSLFLMLIFGSLVVLLLLFLIEKIGEYWWIWGFSCVFLITIFIAVIYPTLIAPIFNKMQPLQNSDLKEEIEILLNKCGFKSSGVFVIDASKRDNRLNAYFGGLGSSKRVVLFDTLINSLEKDEILAVLSHELGHFKHKDILKNIALQFVIFAIIFAVFGNLNIAKYIGILNTSGALLVCLMIFSPILMSFLEPIVSKVSRSCEFGADEFASNLKDSKSMILALKKLGSKNSAFPLSHPVYSYIYHSHPTLYERIKKLENEDN